MRTLRMLVLSTLLLASLALVACAGDAELAGSAADAKQPEAVSQSPGDRAGDRSAPAKDEWPVASAQAIFDAIAPVKLDTIDMKMLGDIASKQGLSQEIEDLELSLQRIASGDLGSGRTGGNETFVNIAEALMSGRSVAIQDLRNLLQAIIRRE